MNKKRAQSTLEYIMIIVAVLTAIAVMMPYVYRGVNAYMRSWEISAQEARHDVGVKVPVWMIDGVLPPPPPPPDCDYTTVTPCNADPDCKWQVHLYSQPDGSCKQLAGYCHHNVCSAGFHPGGILNPCECEDISAMCCTSGPFGLEWTNQCLACSPN